MEIMDKYIQAGEALAEKENDVRQLTKQVTLLTPLAVDPHLLIAVRPSLSQARRMATPNYVRWRRLKFFGG